MKPKETLESLIEKAFGKYNYQTYDKLVYIVCSLPDLGLISKEEAERIVAELDKIDSEEW